MDREERVDNIINIMAEVINKDEVRENLMKHGIYYVPFTSCAAALCDEGYHKIIWHKVIEGDLPENDSVVLAFYKPGYYDTKLYLKNADGEGWWYGTNKCKTEDIIAWTEIPTYEE